MVNNLDWTGPMTAIDFLRDMGKHFPITKMLAKDVVKARLESGISFTEFTYQLIQGNDYYELHQRYGCKLQFGGSDQWGNITAGRRLHPPQGRGAGTRLHHAAGDQSGRHEVRQDRRRDDLARPEMTSPYAFYQFWINAEDRDVIRYLNSSPSVREEIEELEEETAERPFGRGRTEGVG